MNSQEVRRWLGIYVLIMTAVLGGYIEMAPSVLLPLEESDRTSAFQIIGPFFLAQVAVIYKFFSGTHGEESTASIVPSFAVKLPIVLTTATITIALVMMAITGLRQVPLMSADRFKAILTFVVALLNASTVLMIAKYFEIQGEKKPRP